MAVAIVLRGPQDVRLVHWAARIAKARGEPLVLFWASQRRNGDRKRVSSREGAEIPTALQASCDQLEGDGFCLVRDADDEQRLAAADAELSLEVISLSSARVHIDVEDEVDKLDIDCLIVPREPQLRGGTAETTLHDHLLHHVPCEVVLLTAGTGDSGKCSGIVTPVGEGPHSSSCLRLANDIAKVANAKLIALHVEPEVDITARQAAERILTKTVDRALGSDQERVKKRVVLSNNVVDGIKEALDESPDLIILGMKRSGIVRRFSSQSIADKLVNSAPDPTIAVVQSAMPLTSQVSRWLDDLCRGSVPQLSRDRRVSLVEGIQRSSQWDFDFVMLISMSALIAAGGLIEDSAAVVIGAMLVAPLMTPLLGTGLSLTQGNFILFRSTLMTVLRGFLLAFVISLMVGMFAADDVTDQMAARGSPRVLDILVAMVGGIAAAYASCRPNLLSALPGVAIAASLVPPIATSGIATWTGHYSLATGAALLFLTNIVAIILGTWIAFRAVGIRSTHEHGDFERWTLGAAATLLILTVSLGVYQSMPESTGNASATLLHTKLDRLAAQDRWKCTDVEVEGIRGRRVLSIFIESSTTLPQYRLDKIRATVNESFESAPTIKFIQTMKWQE